VSYENADSLGFRATETTWELEVPASSFSPPPAGFVTSRAPFGTEHVNTIAS